MKNTDIKDIITGTIIVLVLFAAGTISPFFGSLCVFCIPLPIMYFRMKSGRNPALVITVLSLAVIVGLTRGVKFDLLFIAQVILMGLVMGESFAKRLPINRVFANAFIATIALIVIWVVAASVNAGLSPGEFLGGFVDRNIAITLEFYRTQGFSTQDIAAMESVFAMAKPWVIKFMPAGALMLYIFTIWANILLARAIFKRTNLPWIYGTFEKWSVPYNVVFAAALGALIWLLAPTGGFLWLAATSLLLVLLPIYCFQGLAIATSLMDGKGIPKAMQIAGFIIAMIIWPLFLAIAILPFLDMWFNFRKLSKTG